MKVTRTSKIIYYSEVVSSVSSPIKKEKIMKRLIISIIVLFIMSNLCAIIHIVGSGQGFDFNTIQSAINFASHGDSIIVHPGIYNENIDFLSKSLFLGSLYTITQDTLFISQTIIDGQGVESVIYCFEVSQATIEGFTIQNGFGKPTWFEDGFEYYQIGNGGGLKLHNIHVEGFITVSNNYIKDNFGLEGGGLYIKGTNVSLNGNQIFRNRGLTQAGGIMFVGGFVYWGNSPTVTGSLTFDSLDKNSIFYNISPMVNDVYIGWRFWYGYLDIPLKKATYSTNSVYQICLYSDNKYITNLLNINIEDAYITEVDADLYVSPIGNDTNSGLSPDDPLKTITRALFKSKSSVPLDMSFHTAAEYNLSVYHEIVNNLDIKTIYVADGIYSENTGDMFPLRMKNQIRIIGESRENTIIDCDGLNSAFVVGFDNSSSLIEIESIDQWLELSNLFIKLATIENFTVQNTYSQDFFGAGGYTFQSSEIKSTNTLFTLDMINLKNIKYENTTSRWEGIGKIQINGRSSVNLQNIYIDRIGQYIPSDLYDGYAITIMRGLYHVLENIRIEGGQAGISIMSSEIYWQASLSNILVKDLYSPDPYYNSDFALYLASGGSQNYPPERPNVRVINSTFHNNNIEGGLIGVYGYQFLDFYNTIIYGNNDNNLVYQDMYMGYSLFAHNLFELPQSYFPINPNNVGNIYSCNPLFIDTGDHPEMLSSDSPAINAGTTVVPDIVISDAYIQYQFAGLCSYEFPDYDLAGNPMIVDGQISMGAYQYQGDVSDFTDNDDSMLRKTQLIGNYPNPFNPETTISYSLSVASNLRVNIYNIRGQKIKTLINGYQAAGNHQVIWDGMDENGKYVSSGIYFYKMEADDFSQIKKMVLMK